MLEFEGKEFKFFDFRLFLVIIYFGLDGVMRFCFFYSGLELGESFFVWRIIGMGILFGYI